MSSWKDLNWWLQTLLMIDLAHNSAINIQKINVKKLLKPLLININLHLYLNKYKFTKHFYRIIVINNIRYKVSLPIRGALPERLWNH